MSRSRLRGLGLTILGAASCFGIVQALGEDGADFSKRPQILGDEAFLSAAPKIANGTPDSVFKLVVEIRYATATGEGLCTGTFVARNKVLTAGHCGCGAPGTYEIHVGQSDGSDGVFPVRRVIQYDALNCSGGDRSGRDLALLVTDTDLDCNGGSKVVRAGPDPPERCKESGVGLAVRQQFANAVTLEEDSIESVWSLRSRLRIDQKVVAVGYGLTERGTFGARLMGRIPILSVTCEEGWYPYLCAPFAEMLLVDRTTLSRAVDTCPGDSGGPVFVFNSDNSTSELIAVVSRAAQFPQGPQDCGGGGVYELIGRKSVIQWLAANGIPDKTIVSTFGQPHAQVTPPRRRIPDISVQPLLSALRAARNARFLSNGPVASSLTSQPVRRK